MPLRQGIIFKRVLFSALLFLAVPVSVSADAVCQAERIDDYATVKEIFDGDTLRLSDNRRVRLIGINTPELAREEKAAEPLAVEAGKKLQQLVPAGSVIGLRFDQQAKDRYQRILAHVFRKDGLNVAAELLRQGYGFAIVVPPNDWQTDCYFHAERQARQKGLGIWSHSYFGVKNPDQLERDQTGFMRVSGRVTRVGGGSKNIWLDMGKRFSIRLRRENLQVFANLSPDELTGVHVTVRGWVSYYNNKSRMSLRHPAMIEILE